MARGKAVAIDLSATERGELDGLLRRHGTTQAVALRARIVLLAAEGLTNTAIADRLGIAKHTAGKWRHRFARDRRDGLHDEPRPGAPRQIGDDAIAETIRRTLETLPAGATHWSLRSMAKVAGYAPSTIHRIWQAFGLQPHRQETFKLSADPLFVEGARHRRALSSATGSRGRAVRGREVPDPGARPHPAALAAAARPSRAAAARL